MPKSKAAARKLEDMFHEPGFLLRRAHQLSTAAFMMEAGAVDITPLQFITLLAISNQPETDAATVSDLIAFDRTTVGQVLFRLESKGLIVKRGSDVDRRKKMLQITDAGQQILDRVLAMTPVIADNIVGVLSPEERRMFISLLQKIISAPANQRLVGAAQ